MFAAHLTVNVMAVSTTQQFRFTFTLDTTFRFQVFWYCENIVLIIYYVDIIFIINWIIVLAWSPVLTCDLSM